MAGIAKMFFPYRLHHNLHVSHSYQAVVPPHLSEELEAMSDNDLVVMERESLGKHVSGELEQFGLDKDEQSSSALSLIRLRYRSHS